MKRVALYGGSFNPIHIGHLALANYLCEWEEVDEVWFLVTPQNPLKKECELLPDRERLKLVEVSIKGYTRFKASDFEFHLPRPSYTIHTLEALKKAYPCISFSLLIGADNWKIIDRWKESERLVRENEIFVYPRYGCEIEVSSLPSTAHYIQAPLIEISSTGIRHALREGKEPVFFLHPNAYKIIKKKRFYQE